MVYAHDFFLQHLAYNGEVAHGEVGVLELFVGHLLVDDGIDEIGNLLLVGVFHAMHGGFYRVADHEDCCLAREWDGSMIGEGSRVDVFAGVLSLFHDVEIVGAACAMVRPDEVDDDARELGFLGQFYAVDDM